MQDKILEILIGTKKNVSLKNYTTYKIGGPAKYFFVAKTKADLISALKAGKEAKLPIFILGGGSNLLISEKGFNGLVIKIDICDVVSQGEQIFVGAGEPSVKLAFLTIDNGLSGLEWASGLPGTIGGAIYGSAQAFGTKISDAVVSVEAVDCKTLKVKNFTKEQCQFNLKNSIFKKNNLSGKEKIVIISAVLRLKGADKEQVKNKVKEFLEYRRVKHPIEFPSAGSVFVNPEKVSKAIIKKFPELADFLAKGAIPAGYLIAKVGLTGKKIGDAQISEKHSNFIINLGKAKSSDVLSLINLAKKEVKKKFNINLETEVQIL